jgi:hypothetical protein
MSVDRRFPTRRIHEIARHVYFGAPQITPLLPTAYFDSGTFGGVVSLLTVLRISCARAIAVF